MSADPSIKKKKILLVDDDYIDIESAKREISKLSENVEFITVHNGTEALNMLTSRPDSLPDILMLDLNMPKMNGLEFLRIFKSYYSLNSIKVFIMSTSEEEYDKIMTENLGIDGYIVKPVKFNNAKSKNAVEKLKASILS